MLRRFQVLRLIRIVGSESDPEATVILHPSISFALDGMAVDEAAALLRETARAGQDEEPEQAEE
jgi:hypothetical protein